MSENEKKIWFPAKKYGYGWGPPNCWQGWVVMILFIALTAGGGLLFMPQHPLFFLAYTIILTICLMIICYIKGEKPEWRWGDKK